MEDGPGGAEEIEGGGFGHEVGDGEGGDGEADAGGDAEEALQGEVGGVGSEGDDWAGVGGGDGGGVEDVVEVLVGEQEGVEFDALGGEPGGHAFGGVDGDGLIREAQEPAVGLGDSAGKMGQCEHLSSNERETVGHFNL